MGEEKERTKAVHTKIKYDRDKYPLYEPPTSPLHGELFFPLKPIRTDMVLFPVNKEKLHLTNRFWKKKNIGLGPKRK